MNLLRCDFDIVPTFPFESVNVLICAHGSLRTRAHEQFVGSEFVCIYFSATVKNAANNNKSCDKLFVMIVAKHTQASAHTHRKHEPSIPTERRLCFSFYICSRGKINIFVVSSGAVHCFSTHSLYVRLLSCSILTASGSITFLTSDSTI